jgi:hypothetical protein
VARDRSVASSVPSPDNMSVSVGAGRGGADFFSTPMVLGISGMFKGPGNASDVKSYGADQ